MPIDPNLALMTYSPGTQVPSPYAQATQALNLQSLANQQAINRQVQQENALKIQAMQRQQQDSQALGSALQKYTTFDPDGKPKVDWGSAYNEAVPQMSLQGAQAAQQEHLEMQRSALAMEQTKRQSLLMNNQLIGQALSAVMQAPDDQKDDVYQQKMTALKGAGIDTSGFPQQRPNDALLNAYAAGVGYTGQILSDADRKALEAQRKSKAQLQQTQEQNQLAEEEAKQRQRMKADAATGYLAVEAAPPEQQQAMHQQWLANLPDKIKADYAPFQTFSPQNAQAIHRMALTPAQLIQQQKEEEQERKDQAKENKTQTPRTADEALALASAATDPAEAARLKALANDMVAARIRETTATQGAIEDRTRMRQEQDDAGAFRNIQKSEQQQWDLAQSLGDTTKIQNGDKFVDPRDPKKTPQVMTDGLRQQLNSAVVDAQNEARNLMHQKGQIFDKWGRVPGSVAGVMGKPPTPASGAPATASTPAPAGPKLSPAPAFSPKWKQRNDVPSVYASQIPEGQMASVNTPAGSIMLAKKNGKMYEVTQ